MLGYCSWQRTLFSRCFQKPLETETEEGLGFILIFFSVISISKFGGVCLLASAHYKQTFVFVCSQTTQAGVSRSLCGNGAFLGSFSGMQCRHEFSWVRKAGPEFMLEQISLLTSAESASLGFAVELMQHAVNVHFLSVYSCIFCSRIVLNVYSR